VFLDTLARGLLWTCDKLDAEGKPAGGYAPKAAPTTPAAGNSPTTKPSH
jgi:hypothetical protein